MRYPLKPEAESTEEALIRRSFLGKMTKTPDKSKRLAILKACAKVRADWVETLFWESLGDPCEKIRDFLINDLGGREAFNLAYALTRLERPPWYAKSAILRILAAKKISEAVPYIAPVLDDENVDVRRSAAFALGEIGGQEAIRMLIRLRGDANTYVRTTAEAAIEKASSLRFI